MALTIPEELLLLRVSVGQARERPQRELLAEANRPLAAARLIELVLTKRIGVEARRRHLLVSEAVVVLDSAPTHDPLLDEVVERLARADAHSCSYWIKRVAKGSEAAYWDRLVSRSLLRPRVLHADTARHAAHA
jgi:hypothetical protein